MVLLRASLIIISQLVKMHGISDVQIVPSNTNLWTFTVARLESGSPHSEPAQHGASEPLTESYMRELLLQFRYSRHHKIANHNDRRTDFACRRFADSQSIIARPTYGRGSYSA